MSELLVEAGANRNVVCAVGGIVENNVERVFDFTIAEDVVTNFLKGEPAVTGYDVHQGPWGQTGSYRTVYFGDQSAREQVNFIQRPFVFDYQLTDFSWELGDLCDLAVNQFLFRPVGPRTQVKFYYQFRARNAEAVQPLHEFATSTWLAWMTSYLDATKKALDKDPWS
ncbi:hypothetical protein GCM10010413_24370 [Promicromonospora sukumoe]|uniref:Polyketide cyclase/dehydrase/lipid transport protein n=1 Tax=Promicromonospora sukumoe TaxID=88382 RepID=A0A7W3J8P5_9MICO|nr:SRPBCC family protein [Promicromonospora sukumoe]MBA8808345.1 hypothetical protein [Promicromonospora sukumoe]